MQCSRNQESFTLPSYMLQLRSCLFCRDKDGVSGVLLHHRCVCSSSMAPCFSPLALPSVNAGAEMTLTPMQDGGRVPSGDVRDRIPGDGRRPCQRLPVLHNGTVQLRPVHGDGHVERVGQCVYLLFQTFRLIVHKKKNF